MARGERIGCFGLTEPDFGSNPAGMRTFARRDGSDWVLDGTKMWITNGSIADLAIVWAQTDAGIRGFIVPRGTRGFHANDIHRKLSLRASVTSELVLSDCRLPGEALLPLGEGLGGPLACLNEARYGIVWGAMGAARPATKQRSSTARRACSSIGQSVVIKSRSRSWWTCSSSSKKVRCSRCTSAE